MKRLLSLLCCGALLIALAGCTAPAGPKEPETTVTEPTATAQIPTAAPIPPEERNERLLYGVQNALYRILPATWEELSWDADYLATPDNRTALAWSMTVADPQVPYTFTRAGYDRALQDYSAWYQRLFGEEGDPSLLTSFESDLRLEGESVVDTGSGEKMVARHFGVKDHAFTALEGDDLCTLSFTLFTGYTPYTDPEGRHYLTGRETDFPANGAEITAVLTLRPAGEYYRAESLTLTPVRQPETAFTLPADPGERAVYANRVMGQNLAYALSYLPEGEGDRVADPKNRALFTWGWLEHANGVPRTYNRKATGDMDVRAADYQTVYRMLFGEEGDPALLPVASSYFQIVGDTVQGSCYTGGYPQTAAKFAGFTESADGTCTLTADVLKNYDEEGYDEGVAALYDPQVTEYPAEAVSYRVTLQLRREYDRYFLVGLYVG